LIFGMDNPHHRVKMGYTLQPAKAPLLLPLPQTL
jgi:hypothetical protein